MIKTIFILDISGSMSDAQIKKGIETIYTKGILLSGREAPAIFCWNPLESSLYQKVVEIKRTYPESSIHFVGDEFQFNEDLKLVDQVTTISL
jgi:hypothetical protein